MEESIEEGKGYLANKLGKLIGFFNFNLVAVIFGEMTWISRVIYALVGISGLWGIKLLFDD